MGSLRKQYRVPIQGFISPLHGLRTEYGWSQEEAAIKVGVTIKTFREWERSYTYPDPEHLIKLSEVFHVSADYLLGRSGGERNLGNAFISEITGLSAESIETLRFFSTPQGDSDTDREHKETVEFINRVFTNTPKAIAQYRANPDNHAPVSTIFSVMMEYIDTKEISLAFWEDGKRREISGAAATLSLDDNSTGYTIKELGMLVLMERIKRILDYMRSEKEVI